MSKLNFAQTLPAGRDLGGASSMMLLLVANLMILVWSVLIYARV
jgi:hypothetical protein